MEQNDKTFADRAAEVAGAVRDIANAGKTIAQGTAESSVGGALGPYGFVAALAWENRGAIAKVIVGLVAILLLPVMLLMMLPSAIFGGEGAAEAALFGDYSVVTKSYNEACIAVDRTMVGAREDAVELIRADFAAYGPHDELQIINPEQGHDATRLICAYSALTDFAEEPNTQKLTQVLSAHRSSLFSYTKMSEACAKIITTTDANGVQTSTEIPYTRVIYTLQYVGDEYVEREIFGLTDDQQLLAIDFAANLKLFMEDDNGATG